MNKIEYSRLVFKRSSQPGVEPTIPTGTTIDSTWLDTDLLVGEGFINVEDDKFWFRTNNGVVQLAMSGVSSDNFYTEYAYTSGNTIVFDRSDTLAAYTVDLGPMLSGFTTGATLSGSYLPLSGSAAMTGAYTAQTIYMDANKNIQAVGGGGSIELGVKGAQSQVRLSTDGTIGGNTIWTLTPESVEGRIAGSRWLIAGSGTTTSSNFNHVGTILSSKNSKIDNGSLSNVVILGGDSITATTSNTAYVDLLNIKSVNSGTVAYNLGVDANGNVIQGAGATISGDTTLGALSATSISILNSGATARQYFDYSNNVVQSGVTNSAIVAGSGNTIPSGLRNVFVAGVGLTASANDTAYFSNVNATTLSATTFQGVPCDLSFAISDEITEITTGTTKLTIYAPYGMTITNVYASLSKSGSTSSQFDVNKNGTTIFSTPLTIDANEFHSKDASTPAVITGATVAQFDRITVDIDSAGAGAKGAKIYILGKRT